MTEARLGGWLKQVGAAVREGEAIAEIESEKSVTELASPADGYLIEILVAANTDEVPVGTLLARIGDAPAVSAAVPSTDRVATLTTLEPPADASGPSHCRERDHRRKQPSRTAARRPYRLNPAGRPGCPSR